MTTIKSCHLFVHQSKFEPQLIGLAYARRKADNGYLVITESWPSVAIGEEIHIETTDHWIWTAIVEEIRDEFTLLVRPVGEQQRMPLPQPVDGKVVLPFRSDDGWSTRPEAGKVLDLNGQYFKVVGKPRQIARGSEFSYTLRPVTGEEYAKRSCQVKITDYTDPNPTAWQYYGHAIGRAVQVGDEWLAVEKISRQPYGSGERDEIFGHITWGVGHFVPAKKAEKLNALWSAKAKVRDAELSLKVASYGDDFRDLDTIPEKKAALEAAKAEVAKLEKK